GTCRVTDPGTATDAGGLLRWNVTSQLANDESQSFDFNVSCEFTGTHFLDARGERDRRGTVRAIRRLGRALERGGGEEAVSGSAEDGTSVDWSDPSDRQLSRLSREATAEEIRSLPDLETLREVAESCVRCPLHESRDRVVFGEGSTEA
ncbi:MAG: hypothetical protein ABEJ00_02395, partial [Gemmatimonadota bacterium]